MRQAGIIAAAGQYALTHHVARLQQDHEHASAVGQCIGSRFGDDTCVVQTNMVHLQLPESTYAELSAHLAQHEIRVGRPRWVFHLDVNAAAIDRIITAIDAF